MAVSMMSARSGLAAPVTRKTVRTSAVMKLFPGKAAAPKSTQKTAAPAKKTNFRDRQQTFKKSTGLEAPAVNGRQFPVKLGFTKSNELFVGRLAMLGFAASLIGEVITGQGALAQFGYETGLNLVEVDGLVLGLIAFNLVAAVLPASQTFVPEEQEALSTRPKGPIQDPTISILEPKKFFGITGFGFTKENELFVGRMAQLGFACSLLGEAITGKGPLAQFGLETGIPIQDTEFALLALIGFLLFAAVNPGSGKFVTEEDGELL